DTRPGGRRGLRARQVGALLLRARGVATSHACRRRTSGGVTGGSRREVSSGAIRPARGAYHGGGPSRPRGRRTMTMPRRGSALLSLLCVVPVPWLQSGSTRGAAPSAKGNARLQALEHVATLDLPPINLDAVFKEDVA